MLARALQRAREQTPTENGLRAGRLHNGTGGGLLFSGGTSPGWVRLAAACPIAVPALSPGPHPCSLCPRVAQPVHSSPLSSSVVLPKLLAIWARACPGASHPFLLPALDRRCYPAFLGPPRPATPPLVVVVSPKLLLVGATRVPLLRLPAARGARRGRRRRPRPPRWLPPPRGGVAVRPLQPRHPPRRMKTTKMAVLSPR